MRNKAFCPRLRAKYDAIGKRLAVDIMRDFAGATHITDNLKEDRGDFSDGFWDQKYSLSSGKEIKVEPEMKDAKWWGNYISTTRPFVFYDMDIPYRKAKNLAHLHIVISTDIRFAFLVTRKTMDAALIELGGKPKIKKTLYEPFGGPYFSTPVERGFFVQRGSDGCWRRWEHP